jgi:hypothetical protein
MTIFEFKDGSKTVQRDIFEKFTGTSFLEQESFYQKSPIL